MNYKNYLAAVIVLAVLIAAFFGAQYLREKDAANLPQNINTQQNNNNNTNNSSTNNNLSGNFTNQTLGFSFNVPADLYSDPGDYTYLPYGNTKVGTGGSYYHEINKQYCAPSGKCTPTTKDFYFSFGDIDPSIGSVQQALKNSGLDVQTKTFGSVKAVTTSQGVEGEGINYYFVAMPSGRTLMFSQKYIDENVLVGYKNADGFIPLKEQNQLMADIISTLTFTK